MEPDYVKLKQIKPALTGYISETLKLIKRSDIPDVKTVHDIRVLMKKSRAVLKLVAHQPDYPYYDKDIADLRETGRVLCCQRDISVQRKVLKTLKKEFPRIFDQLQDNTKLSLILEKHETSPETAMELRKTFDKIDNSLSKTGFRIRFQSMNAIDPQLLLKQLETTYNSVTDLYLSCRNIPKPRTIHEFRKKAKDLLYQLYIFRPLNPPVVKVLEKKLDLLTQNLGRFNDLDQLIKSLDYKYRKETNQPAMDELIIKIREMQDKYLARVWTHCGEIFYPGKRLVNLLGFKILII